MLQTFKNGQTSPVLRVKLLNSSSTTGSGLTGLTSASSGLIISTAADNEATATVYTVSGSTIETITTLGTYAAPTATKCRFKEFDATNNPGVYELQFADARFAVAGAKSLLVSISGATNLAQADFVVQLQSDDPYIAKPANSNLLSIDANGRIDIIKLAGTTQTARDIGASVLLSSGVGTGQVSLTAGLVTLAGVTHTGAVIPSVSTVDTLTTYTGNTPQTGDSFARLGAPSGVSVSADIADVPTVAEFNARTLLAANYFDPALDTVANVTTTGTTTNLTNLPAIPTNWITAAGISAAAITSAKFAANAVDANALAADAVVKIREALMPSQNVAFNNIPFLWVAASDHVTPVTGATTTSVTRSIDGGAFGVATGTLAEIGNGIYQFDASAADMNGGIITFKFSATGGTPGAPDNAFVTIVTGGGV